MAESMPPKHYLQLDFKVSFPTSYSPSPNIGMMGYSSMPRPREVPVKTTEMPTTSSSARTEVDANRARQKGKARSNAMPEKAMGSRDCYSRSGHLGQVFLDQRLGTRYFLQKL